MALNNIQERIERSIFEAIRVILVTEGYLPNIANFRLFNQLDSITDQGSWEIELQAIVANMGFAIELFGNSSSQAKGTKKVPRIVIVIKRIFPGEIGTPTNGLIITNPLDPNNFVKLNLPLETVNIQLDIHLVSNTAKQDRILNAIIGKALSQKKNLSFYDVPTDRFFIKQYNYYELPDPMEGINEKVYSYEVQDLFLFEDIETEVIAAISEINMETLVQMGVQTTSDGSLIITADSVRVIPLDSDGIIITPITPLPPSPTTSTNPNSPFTEILYTALPGQQLYNTQRPITVNTTIFVFRNGVMVSFTKPLNTVTNTYTQIQIVPPVDGDDIIRILQQS